MRAIVGFVRVRLLLMLCLLAPPSAAEPLAAPGPEIVRGENDADWQPLFAALAGQGAVFSQMTERRWFKVRKQPVVLTGEVRLTPEHGLSLHYEDRTVIVDAQGVLLRDARGRTRAVKPGGPNPAVSTWLLPILRFDLPALENTFRVHGARSANDWRLDFVPRDAADASAAGSIVVQGTDDAITRIDLRPKAEFRIEILIGTTRTGVTFSAEDEQRFFR
jgi:hypothetical protein